MDNIKDLLVLELKNLYALEKQINNELESVETPQNKKFSKHFKKLKESNTSHLDQIQDLLKENNINPGNTTDSVASEILKNISDQNSLDLKDNLKDVSVLTSLIRLIDYKQTNYNTARQIAKSLKEKKVAKSLKKIDKKSKKLSKKLKKTGKKKVYTS